MKITRTTVFDLEFCWDNGYGYEYSVNARVEIVGQNVEVTALDVDGQHGEDPSDFVVKCCEEKALDTAWVAYTGEVSHVSAE